LGSEGASNRKLKKTAYSEVSQFVLLTKYYYDQIKDDKMDRICGM
jgi:hypothetical protein